MAIITQNYLFAWKDLQNIGDLKRLKYVLENLNDKKLIVMLYELRGSGRNDYDIKSMWNSIIAGIVFQHPSIESLRRELLRNESLRQICGFNPMQEAEKAVPKPWNYTRFIKLLYQCQDEIQKVFDSLVSEITELLPDFGNFLAHDGKIVEAYAKPKNEGYKKEDGRRDIDANFFIKQYHLTKEDGKSYTLSKTYFGYKVHLIIDANYELPISYRVTKASEGETPIAHEMIEQLNVSHPEILKQAEYFTSDRGNDDVKLIKKLWRTHKIKPLIDIRNMWKDADKTKGLKNGQNVIYNYKGDVSCVCPKSGECKRMAYGGFEKDRNSLKYLCPALHCGLECKGQESCEINRKKYIRISLKEDERIFVPIARSSYKWKSLYKKRTSVERVNSRIDNVFGFEKHFIKSLKKMRLRVSLAMCTMLAMAIGKIKDNQIKHLGCFTKAA
jgi:transposase